MSKKILTPKLTKLVLALVVCLALIFFNPGKILDPVREVFFMAAYPFQKTFYILSKKTENFFSLLGSISKLKKENERIAKENLSLLAQMAGLREQKKENEMLRTQLGLIPRREYELEAAFVISHDPRGAGSWIMIDKGRADGIETDMPAIVSNGILIGRVAEVYEKSAKVALLTDSGSAVNVIDLETGARGILSGKYNLGLTLGMVQQTEVLNVGDEIVTSGLGGSMPKGLLVGNIREVGNTEDKLFQEAQVSTKVKYDDLEIVFILKGDS